MVLDNVDGFTNEAMGQREADGAGWATTTTRRASFARGGKARVECVRSPGDRSHSVRLKPDLLDVSIGERLRNSLAGLVDCFVRGRRQLFCDGQVNSGREAV